MKILNSSLIMTGLFAAVTLLGCSDKKSFSGSPASAQAAIKDPPSHDDDQKADTTVTVDDSGSLFKDCDATTTAPFIGDLFALSKGEKKLPDFSTLSSLKKVCLNQIDIATRSFTEGFPGVDDLKEWFGINFNFNVKIETAGDYQFRVNSDDGSKLYIDGNLVIDNDGQHSTKSQSGHVQLSAGVHKLNLQYFQGPADQIALELFWTPPGASESAIPPALVSRP